MASGIATVASTSQPAALRPLGAVVGSGIRLQRYRAAPFRPRTGPSRQRILRLLYDSRRTPGTLLSTLPSVGWSRSLAGLTLLAGLTSACAIGPDYARPDVPAKTAWDEAGNAAGDADEALAAWWERFGDAQLTGYVERAAQDSLEIRIAAARVAEARALRRVAGSEQLPALVLTGEATEGMRSPGDTLFGALELFFEVDLWGRVRRSVEA